MAEQGLTQWEKATTSLIGWDSAQLWVENLGSCNKQILVQ